MCSEDIISQCSSAWNNAPVAHCTVRRRRGATERKKGAWPGTESYVVGPSRAHSVAGYRQSVVHRGAMSATCYERAVGSGAAERPRASAGKPRLEPRTAERRRSLARASRTTRRARRAPPAILALEPWRLMPVYLARAEAHTAPAKGFSPREPSAFPWAELRRRKR